MTEPIENKKARRDLAPRLFGTLVLLLLLLFLCRATESARLVKEGLLLCAARVIPSLFPFTVLSSLLLSSGALYPLAKRLSRPIHALFGLGGNSGCALILGLVCGFPVGTSVGVSLYEQGEISESELSRLLSLANHPSPAFLFYGVGVSLFNDRRLWFLLVGVTLCSTLLIGVCQRLLRGAVSSPKDSPLPPTPRRISLCLTDAVSNAARSMLSVSGFVVFFYTLTGILASTPSNGALPPTLHATLLGFFELTGGVHAAAQCPAPASYILTAMLSGWSGLSVHFQIMSLCPYPSVSFRPYFVSKVAECLLNGVLLTLVLMIIGKP